MLLRTSPQSFRLSHVACFQRHIFFQLHSIHGLTVDGCPRLVRLLARRGSPAVLETVVLPAHPTLVGSVVPEALPWRGPGSRTLCFLIGQFASLHKLGLVEERERRVAMGAHPRRSCRLLPKKKFGSVFSKVSRTRKDSHGFRGRLCTVPFLVIKGRWHYETLHSSSAKEMVNCRRKEETADSRKIQRHTGVVP